MDLLAHEGGKSPAFHAGGRGQKDARILFDKIPEILKNPDEYLNCDLKYGLSEKPAPKIPENYRKIWKII